MVRTPILPSGTVRSNPAHSAPHMTEQGNMFETRTTGRKTLRLTLALLGVYAVAAAAAAQEPTFELLPDITDQRRQVEMLWQGPDSGDGPFAAVLFVHGFQPREADMLFAPGAKAMLEVPPRYPLYEVFRQKGFLVAAVSQAGYGNTDGPLDFCGPLSQQAIATAIAALRSHPAVDPERVFLHGRSRGAVASSVVAMGETGIAGVILESGVYDLRSEYESLLEQNTEPYIYIAANIELEAGKTDEVFIERSVLLTDRGIPVPSLVIHGTEDPNTPVTQAIRLEEHLRRHGSDVQLAVFQGDGHHVPPEKTASLIETFIARVLNGTSTEAAGYRRAN